MKKFILSLFAIMLVTMTACESAINSENEAMAREIASQLKTSLNSINDSSFNNVVITSINENDSDISVSASDITSDEKGNLYVNIYADNDSDDFPGDWWIGIVAILAVFLSPLLFVFIVCHFIFKSKRDRNRVIMEAIASGYTLPDRFYNIPDRKPRLQPAANYLAWSAGFFAFFMINGKTGIAMLTIIPFIIGLGKLATYIIASRKKEDNGSNDNSSNTTFCENAE